MAASAAEPAGRAGPLRSLALTLAALALAGAVAWPLGQAAGFVHWDPDPGAWRLAVMALVFPALAEEAVFRGPLLCWRQPWVAAVSLVAFVLWHPLQTLWYEGAAAVFLEPGFLVVAGLLGVLATVLVRRTGRLFPAVLLHWGLVAGWILIGDGPPWR